MLYAPSNWLNKRDCYLRYSKHRKEKKIFKPTNLFMETKGNIYYVHHKINYDNVMMPR